jgi:hypothetical protein
MCHVACVKNIKVDAKNKAFHLTILVFLHRPQNVSIFGETLQTRLDCEYVNAKFLVNFFDISKYVSWVEGAYVPRSQIEFLQSLGIYTPYLLSVATCSKERKYKKERKF